MNTLEVDLDGDVAHIRLARPDQRNAIDTAMIGELHEVCEQLERAPRVAVITGGTDGFFAAGADIAALRERGRDDALAGINLGLFERIRALPMPTIAAIDGHALGGGAELTYACDIRIGTPRTRIGQPEPGLGIIAGAGACYRLTRLVGESVAKQILLGGRILDAERAHAVGLLDSIVDPDELLGAATSLAQRIGRSSPIAMRMTKLAVDAAPDAHPQLDLAIQAMLFADPDKHDRMTAFLERRR
ncbi:enoyl-CoA hydratase/isomerase family protein [Gordonia sp. NPDC003429]